MFTRTAALTTLLALTGLGATSAQAQYFGVRWTASYLYGVTASQAPQIVVQTTVGSQFSLDGKLRAQAKVFYVDGRTFGGDIQADATARIVVLDIPAGVTLESVSGAVYPVVPAN